jgi:hypothetical protein
VWQNQNVGPVYLAHSLASQAGEGYNYGYNEGSSDVSITVPNAYYDGTSLKTSEGFITGNGGQDDLAAANGNFNTFNPEQQGQITMQYFTRRYLLNQTASQYAPWQTFIDVIQA